MIRGQVRPVQDNGVGLEARIDVDILGSNLVFQALQVIVDTGFTGDFSLPEPIAQELGLHSTEMRNLTLANGQSFRTAVCVARLLWHGQPIDLPAYLMGNKPMIGAALLANCRLTIDWWDGGDVVIEERAPPVE
jgi:clan AA aspartic protease